MASPSKLPASVWRADGLGHATSPGLPSGFAHLDAELPGGGWPVGALTELIARDPGIGEVRLLVPLLRRITRQRQVAVLLAPPHVPYPPALAAFGVDLDWLLVVDAPDAADRLWATEQAIKSAAFGALLAWLPHDRTRAEHLRRMQLAAQQGQGPVFLFRPLPAQFGASPAPLRLLLEPAAEQRLSVRILKRRGPMHAAPLLLDLPQPASALRLRVRRPSTVQGGTSGPPARVAAGARAPASAPAVVPGLVGAHPLLPACPDGPATPLH